MSPPIRNHDGIWRNREPRTLAEMEGMIGSRESIGFTVAEMKRLNAWLTKHGANVDPTTWGYE